MLDDQDYHSKSSFSSRCGSQSTKQTKQESENAISELEAKGVEEHFDGETDVISELFDGFLSIGTLGSEKMISEPATPTFSTSMQNVTGEQADVTEYDLKFINDKLEKFLETEAEEEQSKESSRRNSYVSIVTLSEKLMEGASTEDYGKIMVCPLQGYLFGTSIELPETTEVKKEKASLAELFHRTKIADEISTEKSDKGEMQAKQTHKSVKHLFKKMLKKLHATLKSSTPSNGDTAAVSTNKKLHKIIQMFHRKIHPENSIAEKEFIKSHTKKINGNPRDGSCVNGGLMHSEKSNKKFPQGSTSKQGYMANIIWPQYGLKGIASSGYREHWIKTDADYLVLEL
ncbi:protein LAZY 1-like isoform X2 [Mangifera indica]|uniref:protein LAZY 1-like isoform X2 n=1 Tax=Mangifera indica TaxID=29780 RepID=UPI001CFB5404|nr:protein LAZY 1-like isoform X2 [Mangifera indica]